MSRLLISAAHKSSGKTTITIGLCAALAETKLAVQPFKKGPDYIDPMWLSKASGRPCHNLDFYTMQAEEIIDTVAHNTRDSDIAIIEGNKGLYDGLDLDGSNSNAALAELLKTPVILVLDARGMTRGIAPLILGYQAFDPDIQIAGVILNQLGGSRHESKLRSVIEHYTDISVVGAVYRNTNLSIDERHLGLIPSNEDQSAENKISQIRDIIKDQIDLELITGIARQAQPITGHSQPVLPSINKDLRIGIVKNAAFGFYYPGDLQALEQAGAELITIDTINDQRLPEIDGLFIGGGFPETRMDELEANTHMRQSIKSAIDNGLPAYAECGGLMYLSRSLKWKNKTASMAGVIQADTVMHETPQGRGYIRLEESPQHPWASQVHDNKEIAGHEFHYSALENIDPSLNFAYRILRGSGIDGQHDGIIYKNLLACYAHLRDTRANHWAARFVEFIRQCKKA
ncbi:MAG: hydrogenobyrinic acid a,c-diamide synthase (glutamine-hydrolyzing) [Gammaproteobacteria bacterium]|nr:hydrogenobyrinic acid a,c-diamide synthase (glutamine-hydrolyzing) [Gammaproteobacteria bacterium]MCW8911148.1 hydrogenobyrinic acid a,c-diamide synthase (glutamine-hydrolyzing) [Gammaproteobacteria bacterium]MCW9005736.1 hydrogenobyrinic acid a,c-diamide synthase (glutamine-hydrolyzing) [Gammaproteobacteria bacterium]MCW9055896.1 hydrogenobyrinic acid a,c-diamide synthase (glutamine-hydrolyzing) [Gammaproteobacteria bacterium]